MSKKTLTIRLDEETLQKLRVIAEREERSVNGQIMVWVRKFLERSEQNQTAPRQQMDSSLEP